MPGQVPRLVLRKLISPPDAPEGGNQLALKDLCCATDAGPFPIRHCCRPIGWRGVAPEPLHQASAQARASRRLRFGSGAGRRHATSTLQRGVPLCRSTCRNSQVMIAAQCRTNEASKRVRSMNDEVGMPAVMWRGSITAGQRAREGWAAWACWPCACARRTPHLTGDPRESLATRQRGSETISFA